MKARSYLLFSMYLFLFGYISNVAFTQSCNCLDYMYLNDVGDHSNGYVHKFQINPNGTFVEIPNGVTGTLPWFPSGGGLPSPHGLASDLNGNLYIGEYASGSIRKLNCKGEITPLSEFSLTSTQIPLLPVIGGYNFTSVGNTLLVNNIGSERVSSYDLCTGNEIGYIRLQGVPDYNGGATYPSLQDWGFHVDKNTGTFYNTVGFYDDPIGLRAIYKYTPTDLDFQNHTIYAPIVIIDPNTFSGPTGGYNVWGITTDNLGNMFVVVLDGTATWILKFNSSGTLIGSTSMLNTNDAIGFDGARGIVYLNTTNKLYLPGGPTGDCVAIVNPQTLAYEGAAVPHVPGQETKGIALNVECCPFPAIIAVDTVLCNATLNEKINLRSLIDCSGIICEGVWTPVIQDGVSYNDCDQSVTIIDNGACGEYNLIGTGGNGSVCGAFTVNLKIEVANLTPVNIVGTQTICEGTRPTTFTVSSGGTSTTHNLEYQWQQSLVSCNGPWTNVLGANMSSYTPLPLSQTTYYRLVVKTISTCSTKNCQEISNCITITTEECCNINAIVPQILECLDNGTPALITDNRIRFSANVTNSNALLTGYNVTINGGTTITPNMNVPYGVTQFTLGAGTAGGGATYTVTVTDSATPGCTQTFQVIDPGTCTPATPECPPVQCGTATIQVNGN